MLRISLFFSVLLFPFWIVAQCESCVPADGFKADYCFTSEHVEGHCAQFSLDEAFFYLQTKAGKDPVRIDLPQADASLSYLVGLIANKSLKIKKPETVAFLGAALDDWTTRRRSMRIERIKEEVYDAEALEAFSYEEDESGVGIQILELGTGPRPQAGQNVTVHYRGYLTDGSVFDASYDRGQPFSFPIGAGRVIQGWDKGVAQLPVGTRALLRIPAELGYGARGVGSIPPNSTLIFDVYVLDVE